jgi:hypothetical protein
MGTLLKLLLMRHSRRLEVGSGAFCERGIVYISNGIKTANSVKLLFRVSLVSNFRQKIMGNPNILGVAPIY